MTDAELKALEAAAKAATPGPWVVDSLDGCSVFYHDAEGIHHLIACCYDAQSKDAAYIAAANPAAVLELIAELRQAKAEKDWLAENLENTIGSCGLTSWLQAAKEAASCQTKA